MMQSCKPYLCLWSLEKKADKNVLTKKKKKKKERKKSLCEIFRYAITLAFFSFSSTQAFCNYEAKMVHKSKI